MGVKNIVRELAQQAKFEQALDLASSITDPVMQAVALRELVEQLVKAELVERAKTVLQQILDLAASSDLAQYRGEFLRGVAKQLAHLGDFPQALAISHTITEQDEQAGALKEIVEELARQADFPQALENCLCHA